jgi:hypothetical protein
MALGPVEYVMIEFPSTKAIGDIVPALQELVTSGTVRIIDLMFIRKDADGHIQPLEVNQLDGADALRYESLDAEIDDLVNARDIEIAASELSPDSIAAVLVWEDTWATRFAETMRAAGGRVVEDDRIPHEVVEAAMRASIGTSV